MRSKPALQCDACLDAGATVNPARLRDTWGGISSWRAHGQKCHMPYEVKLGTPKPHVNVSVYVQDWMYYSGYVAPQVILEPLLVMQVGLASALSRAQHRSKRAKPALYDSAHLNDRRAAAFRTFSSSSACCICVLCMPYRCDLLQNLFQADGMYMLRSHAS